MKKVLGHHGQHSCTQRTGATTLFRRSVRTRVKLTRYVQNCERWFAREWLADETLPKEFEEHLLSHDHPDPSVAGRIASERIKEKVRQSLLLLRIWS